MPIIRVSGVPSYVADDELQALREELQAAVASIKALGLSPGHTTVVFPVERCVPHAIAVIAKIEGLFERFERSIAVRNELAATVGRVLDAFMGKHAHPTVELVEVLVDPPFYEKRGYWKKS